MAHSELFTTEIEARIAGRKLEAKGYGYTITADLDEQGRRTYRLDVFVLTRKAA